MGISKTLGSVKRFGARYGRTSRHKVGRIEHDQRKKHVCPYCRKEKVKRVSAGIWFCHCCSSKFTGRAYIPSSDQKQSFIKKEAEEEQIDESLLLETTKSEGQKYREAKVEKVKSFQDLDEEAEEETKKTSKKPVMKAPIVEEESDDDDSEELEDSEDKAEEDDSEELKDSEDEAEEDDSEELEDSEDEAEEDDSEELEESDEETKEKKGD